MSSRSFPGLPSLWLLHLTSRVYSGSSCLTAQSLCFRWAGDPSGVLPYCAQRGPHWLCLECSVQQIFCYEPLVGPHLALVLRPPFLRLWSSHSFRSFCAYKWAH